MDVKPYKSFQVRFLSQTYPAIEDFTHEFGGGKNLFVGYVYEFLRSQGFVSSYYTAHHYTDADAHKWVSH
ncbi:putative calcium-binding protein [Prunus yedoensis var. nudiflora]|uniref:Putative calcium-binding protein n=1 Tax=Prunus yedoensis var. nudiflora TaxID=2094558 RepID=A0A314YRL5_PRUYE|nr:putative calcium-binding protein [Prunus yedoensis var. nudiflora]